MLHVPVPPLPCTAPVSVKDAPIHTVVVLGDLVAVGAAGSVVTVQLYTVSEEISQPLPLQFVRILILLSVPVAVIVGTEVEYDE